ncbi:unnamed protein product [Clonostachys byssicola]|uniref:HAUS augmin-like complex subunit 4 n=1 Tax=Clonostachys byssicola TaxID=160290 RepID=A0A9N9U6C0_9HYPO|nr:unnamed protein product [Clonostachys byssicola]
MFPPVHDAVLTNNPDFANLYNKLTKAILNPDGSTKEDPSAKEREHVQEELKAYRLKAAKQHLITRTIATLSPPEQSSTANRRIARPSGRPQAQAQPQQAPKPSLPEPLLDLLLILPPLLNPAEPLPQDSLSLLLSSPPLSDLESLLPDLTNLISSALRSSALDLARIAHPSTNPSYLHRHVASLSQTLTTLTDLSAASTASLHSARILTLTALTALLHDYTTALGFLLRVLEAKHGVVARSLELRASSAVLQAQRTELDAEIGRWALRRDIYTPEAISALRNYASHLRDAKVRAEERLRGLAAELGEYGVGVDGGEGKEKTMKEMARVYRDMMRQVADAEGDLDRLERA